MKKSLTIYTYELKSKLLKGGYISEKSGLIQGDTRTLDHGLYAEIHVPSWDSVTIHTWACSSAYKL